MAAWSHTTLKNNDFVCFFWKNDHLLENFQNTVPKVFIATPMDVLCSNFVKFGRREIGKIVCYLPDKKYKNSPGSAALVTAWIPPKICQGQPPSLRQCAQSAPDFVLIGLLSAELFLNAWTPSERAPKWIQYSAEAIASSPIKSINYSAC